MQFNWIVNHGYGFDQEGVTTLHDECRRSILDKNASTIVANESRFTRDQIAQSSPNVECRYLGQIYMKPRHQVMDDHIFYV